MPTTNGLTSECAGGEAGPPDEETPGSCCCCGGSDEDDADAATGAEGDENVDDELACGFGLPLERGE